jgi:DNA modification methylase
MAAGDKVHVAKGQVPDDYHCSCDYCRKVIGELIQPSGDYYNRLERRQYYDPIEKGQGGHIAKTPLHVARWAIQNYSKPGDWVLDPTIGAGTTAVEAITQGRSVVGMEIEYGEVVKANVRKSLAAIADPKKKPQAMIGYGDARNIGDFLAKVGAKYDNRFALVVNNPPYSGDVSMPSPKGKLRGKEHRHLETTFQYDKTLPNLAFLKEGQEYWDEMMKIYAACVERMVPGGHFVIGIKDMSRNKTPFLLHKMFADQMLEHLDLKFVGTAFLNHYPRTLHLNTCEQRHGFKPPFYQTITVFRKPETGAAVRRRASDPLRGSIGDRPKPPLPDAVPQKEKKGKRK